MRLRRASLAVVAAVAALVAGAGSATAAGSGHRPAPAARPMIALTFDDGPSELTPQVLRILERHHIKATFFMQGSHVAEHPDLARRVAIAGNVIGNHSYTHPDFPAISDEQADQEITRTNQVITDATGSTPVLFRYPYGDESAAGNAVIRREQMWGGVLWHWTVDDPGDFECPGRKGVVQYMTDNAVDQGIVLLHDGNDVLGCGRRQVQGLDRAITRLEQRGFRFGVVAPADGPNSVNQQSWVKVVAASDERRR